MTNRLLLLCLLFGLISICCIEARGGGRGGSHGGSHSRGGSHSHGGSHGGGHSWFSWGGGSHSYPSSSTGLSGTGSHGSHSYPSGPGLSGNGRGGSHSYSSGSGFRYGSGYGSYNVPPSYHSSPQYVYINQYRDSGSRYGDLLTGLTLYNMGRSHREYHHYYYNDDYYRGSSSFHSNPRAADAKCTLTIKEKGKLQVLKIPCDIVSTFTDDGQSLPTTTTTASPKECYKMVNISSNETTSHNDTVTSSDTIVNTSNAATVTELTDTANTMLPNGTLITNQPTNASINRVLNATTTGTMLISTKCPDSITYTSDPTKEKGPRLQLTKDTECTIEIEKKDSYIRKNVDCSILMKYAKMPDPKRESLIVPQRSTLKSWLNKPPWWLSIFIAA